MDELIKLVADQLGLDEAVVKKSLGAILAFVKEKATNLDFNKLLADLGETAQTLLQDEDAENAVHEATRDGPGGDGDSKGPTGIFGLIFTILKAFGVMEMLKKLLQPVFGESVVKMLETVEDGAELAVVLEKLGVSREKAVQMVKMLFDFVKEKAGPETVQKVVDEIPAVKVFLGEAKKED